MLITELLLLDQLLQQHAVALGADLTAYRNHCYRVVNFCAALSRHDDEALKKMSIAAAFHDLAIWTDGTFDYLDPSEQRARTHLAEQGQQDWATEIGAMIQQHHKVTPYSRDAGDLSEAFRKADLVDVSGGLVTFGIPRQFVREVRARFPNAGFHKRLVQLSGKRLLSHPLSPMPMMRW